MDKQNEKAGKAFVNPLLTTYSTSGNEYFNLDIQHDHVENATIQHFVYDSNQVTITNVRHAYNYLDFDV